MAYNNYFPAGYQPYPPMYQNAQNNPMQNNPMQSNQQQNGGVIWVQGLEGAKAYPVSAGQAVLLMDSDSNCLYLKSADQTGMPSLRVFDYTERTETPSEPQNLDMSGFVTKEDLSLYVTKDELKKAISDIQKEKKKKVKDDE